MTPIAPDYIDVAERVRQFKERYPEGTLQSYLPPYLLDANGKSFIVYAAAAYRTPDDPRPGIGWAWEPVPGPTTFTRDSELQNAETSAWGRAIVALGFETKHIASADEVRNRQGSNQPQPQRAANGNGGGGATEAQVKNIERLIDKLNRDNTLGEPQLREAMVAEYGTSKTAALSKQQASNLIERLKAKAGEDS